MVGNKGRVGVVPSLFSKCPEMHRRVLEILGDSKAEDSQ